jgi:hypothetical protein
MWQEHKPDKLDQFCTKFLDMLREFSEDPRLQINLLEQCIDYCEMKIFNEKNGE